MLDTQFPIVCLRASAGSLSAIKAFFRHMPADSGMTFVGVMYLSPNHESHLAQLLARHTRMSVQVAEDGLPVGFNHVYVLTPGTTLTIRERALQAVAPACNDHTPTDAFFCALAEGQSRFAIVVVLFGACSDSSIGVRAVKEHGGMVIIQSDGVAECGEMPRDARLGDGDYVLPMEEMSPRLIEYAAHLEDAGDSQIDDGLRKNGRQPLKHILALLTRAPVTIFRNTKKNTVIRRIERRMQVNRSRSPADYLNRLCDAPEETKCSSTTR
jgi:two-component system, chemotaxis family, CheB/CheR fusion protein